MTPSSLSARLRPLRVILTLAALLGGAPPFAGQAQDTAAPSREKLISVAEVVQMALTNNLDILISQYTPVLDQFNINGQYAAYDPLFSLRADTSYYSSGGGFIDPQTGYPSLSRVTLSHDFTPGLSGALPSGLTYNLNMPIDNQTVPSVNYYSSPSISLSQPILKNFWIDNTRLQIQLSRQTMRSDQLDLRLQVMNTVNNIKAAYYNLIYARENVKVQRAALQLAQQLVDENTTKVRLGALAALDQRQAESQAATSLSDLLAAEQAQAIQENVLKSIMALHLSDWTDVTPVPSETLLAVPEDVNLHESLLKALELRPDMRKAKITVEKQHLTIKYTRNQLYPEVDLNGSYGRNSTALTFTGSMEGLRTEANPSYTYGVVISVPLENRAARNNFHAAKATLEQLLLLVKRTEAVIVVAVDNDVKSVRSDFLRVDSTRKAYEFAADALRAGQAKLKAGSITSFEVLQLQSNLTAAHSAEIRALADYNIAVEQLAFDEGTILERNHIDLKMP